MDKDVGVLGVDLRPGDTGTAAGLAGCEQVVLGRRELQREHHVRNGLGSSCSVSQLPSLQFLEGMLSGVSKKL